MTEQALNGLGYYLLMLKLTEPAIHLLGLNVKYFPRSANAYDSLAEAYYTKGDKKKALELYRKSVELNPNNDNGRQSIERIEKELNN